MSNNKTKTLIIKTIRIMTKIELINEMYNVIINNADVFEYPHKHMTEYYANKVRTTKKAELEKWLAKLNAMVEEAKKSETVETEAETVETEVENNTENTTEPKATKKDIIMGLHKDGSVECDLATAEELAQEGFIIIDRYEDGVLYGKINRSEILKEMFNDVEYNVMERADELWAAGMDDIEIVTDLFDCGYIEDIKYNGDGNWYCRVDWYNILTAFCKRWDNKLDEAA